MTELQTEGEAQEFSPDAVSADVSAQDADISTDGRQDEAEAPEGENPSREAARYRRRLRDAEGERDSLANQLDTARRQMVSHLAESQGTTLSALEFCGSSVAALTDESGLIDADAVAQAVSNARVQLGGKPHMSKPDAAQGQNGSPLSSPQFSEGFKPHV